MPVVDAEVADALLCDFLVCHLSWFVIHVDDYAHSVLIVVAHQPLVSVGREGTDHTGAAAGVLALFQVEVRFIHLAEQGELLPLCYDGQAGHGLVHFGDFLTLP